MLDLSGKDDLSVIRHLDDKLHNAITEALSLTGAVTYVKADLDKKVNSSETLREYIRDTELEFNLSSANLDSLNTGELNSYVRFLDKKWEGCL